MGTVYSNEVRTLLSRLLAKNAQERPSSAEIVAMPHVRRSIAAVLSHSKKSGSGCLEVDVSQDACASIVGASPSAAAEPASQSTSTGVGIMGLGDVPAVSRADAGRS